MSAPHSGDLQRIALGPILSRRRAVLSLSRGACPARDALAIVTWPSRSVSGASACSNSSRDGNSSKARRRGTIVEIPMDANLSKEIVETAHRRFPRLAHDAQRQVFESGRAVNLLDSAGFGVRAWRAGIIGRKFGD